MVPATVTIMGVEVPQYRLLIFAAALLLMVLLQFWVSKSRMGKAMRAVAQSPDLARVVGINYYATVAVVFFVATGIGGVTGALVALERNLDVSMGVLLGFKGFTASIIGGIGSLSGALVGGLLLGLAEHFFAGYLSVAYKDTLTFLLLLVFLLFLPQGLFGKRLRQE